MGAHGHPQRQRQALASPDQDALVRGPVSAGVDVGPLAPSPSPRMCAHGVLQVGVNIPRMKAPRRGPLMTPMTVKGPGEWVGGCLKTGRPTLS